MEKELSKNEFKEYLKREGETVAKTTKDFKKIPIGTEIKFTSNINYAISSYRYDLKTAQFKYDFDVEWDDSWESYKGKFVVDIKSPAEQLLGTKIAFGHLPEVREKLKELGFTWNNGTNIVTSATEVNYLYFYNRVVLSGTGIGFLNDKESKELTLTEFMEITSEKKEYKIKVTKEELEEIKALGVEVEE